LYVDYGVLGTYKIKITIKM